MSVDGGLRPIFRDKLRVDFHWQSVETGGTGLGTPDSNYAGMGQVGDLIKNAEGWVEYKQTDGWACTLRPEQVGWLVKRAMIGGRVFVATRRWHDGGPRKGESVDELYLHWGGYARELKTAGLGAAPAYLVMSGGPSRWDWDAVRHALLTKGLAGPG